MKVLLIGHKGYIGSTIQQTLTKQGHVVYGFDIDMWNREIHDVWAEVYQAGFDAAKVTDADVGIFAGGVGHIPPFTHISPEHLEGLNARVPSMFVHKVDIPWVVLSSMSVWEAPTDDAYYAESKRILERTMVQYGYRVAIIRPGTVYGISDPACWRRHLLINSMIYTAVTKRKVFIPYDSIVRAIVYLPTLVEKIIDTARVLINREIHTTFYNVYDAFVSVPHIGRLIASELGAQIMYLPRARSARGRYAYQDPSEGILSEALMRRVNAIARWVEEHKDDFPTDSVYWRQVSKLGATII